MVHNLEDTFPDRKKMLDQGVKQLRAWLKKNPEYQKRLDEYLEPDFKYWEKVENQV
jgi:CHASE3 domain sensor protein